MSNDEALSLYFDEVGREEALRSSRGLATAIALAVYLLAIAGLAVGSILYATH